MAKSSRRRTWSIRRRSQISSTDTEEDLLYGLNKLLTALEGINGRTVLDKRVELRNQFYLELSRKPDERVSEFCSKFRTTVADLRNEGVTIPDSELGWWLKEKLGLDPLRKQLLETALAGREEYNVIETESLRLFKDLHESDPLFRRPGTGGKFLAKRMPPPASATSSTSTRPSFFSPRHPVPQRHLSRLRGLLPDSLLSR